MIPRRIFRVRITSPAGDQWSARDPQDGRPAPPRATRPCYRRRRSRSRRLPPPLVPPPRRGASVTNDSRLRQLIISCPAPSNAAGSPLSSAGVAEQERAALDEQGRGEASRPSRRVPRHARARAAQPPRRHPDRAAGDRSRRRLARGARPPARHHRASDAPSGAPGRRPARRLALGPGRAGRGVG